MSKSDQQLAREDRAITILMAIVVAFLFFAAPAKDCPEPEPEQQEQTHE